MQRDITFECIYNYGQVVEETALYKYVQLLYVVDRYDSNMIQLKQMPDEAMFEEMVEVCKEKAEKFGHSHGKLVLPPNEKPDETLMKHAKQLGFEWSFLELYAVKPREFVTSGKQRVVEGLEVSYAVDVETVEAYLQMHYDETVQWGEQYANRLRSYKRELIRERAIRGVVAKINGEVVGSTDLIFSNEFVEIDNFFVHPKHQKIGIGSSIQQFVMQEAGDRTVILVADGEDTPRKMYQRQGYQYYGFRYAALKAQLIEKA